MSKKEENLVGRQNSAYFNWYVAEVGVSYPKDLLNKKDVLVLKALESFCQ